MLGSLNLLLTVKGKGSGLDLPPCPVPSGQLGLSDSEPPHL